MCVFGVTVFLFLILISSVLLLIPSLCFCPCVSSTCCGSVYWNVGRKSLGFAQALHIMNWPSRREVPIAAPALTEQWKRGGAWLGELMEKVEMPSILCQEENNPGPCAGAHQGSLGWASDCEAWWMVLLPPALFLDWTVSTVLLQKDLDREFTPFLNLTHMVFAEKKAKWWRVI